MTLAGIEKERHDLAGIRLDFIFTDEGGIEKRFADALQPVGFAHDIAGGIEHLFLRNIGGTDILGITVDAGQGGTHFMGEVVEHTLSAVSGIAKLCHLIADALCHAVEIGGKMGEFIIAALIGSDMEASACDILSNPAQLFEGRIKPSQEQIEQNCQKRGSDNRSGGKGDDQPAEIGIEVADILGIGEGEAIVADGLGDENITHTVGSVACHFAGLGDFQVGRQGGMSYLTCRLKAKVNAFGGIKACVGHLQEMGGAALRILGISLKGRDDGELLGTADLLGCFQIGFKGIEGEGEDAAVQKDEEEDEGKKIGTL